MHALATVADYWPALLRGAELTAWLTLGSLALGLLIGLILALLRLAPWWPVRWGAIVWIEVIRGIPLLVLILFLYFGVLRLMRQELGPDWGIDSFGAAVAALGICYGAYIAEVFRAGIQSVPPGQTEAARALGLSGGQTMAHVVLPQAVRNVMPALVNQAVALLKDTSLASMIAVVELTYQARTLVSGTYDTFGVWGFVALFYLALTISLSLLARLLERKQRRDRLAAAHSRA